MNRRIVRRQPARALEADEALQILLQGDGVVDLGTALDLTHNGQGKAAEGGHARR